MMMVILCVVFIIIKIEYSHLILVPIIVDTQIMAIGCLWNQDGSILAVCGNKTDASNNDSNVVMFYTAFGVVSFFFIHVYYYLFFIIIYFRISIYVHLKFLVVK